MSITLLASNTFLFGQGLFETFPFRQGELFFFKEHWYRLKNSASQLGFTFPFQYDDVYEAILEANHLQKNESGVIRLTYKSGQLILQYLNPKPRPSTYILIPRVVYPFSDSAHKTTQREQYEEHLQLAQEAGGDDALYVSQEGEILETTRANVFIQKNGELLTPPLNGSVLPGVMRNQVFKEASLQGITVREQAINQSELKNAEDIFITNSVIGIKQVSQVKGVWESHSCVPVLSQSLLTRVTQKILS